MDKMCIRITLNFNIFIFNKIKGMNMWIITCGKRHDLGRLKGSDGLFIELLYLFSIRLPAAREKRWASLRHRQTQPIRKPFRLPKRHATAHY